MWSRFEFFMIGWEMANAYSELNDPIDQRERFAQQDANAAAGDDEAEHTDEDFPERAGNRYAAYRRHRIRYRQNVHAAYGQRGDPRCAALPHNEEHRRSRGQENGQERGVRTGCED